MPVVLINTVWHAGNQLRCGSLALFVTHLRSVLVITLSCLLLLPAIYFLRNHEEKFSPAMVVSSLAPQAEWEIAPPAPDKEKKIRSILSQRFSYLSEGAQAIAFESEDQKYVLKLFKMRRFTPSLIDYLCPHVVRRRLKNLNWVFNGYKNAYEDLRKETGLVWIHLTKTTSLNQTITLFDDEGYEYTLDADSLEFVIQEKAELIFDRFSRLKAQGKTSELERAIDSIYALIQHKLDKGYVDRDKAVSNNYGFVGDRPIQLDIGRLYKGEREGQLEHIQRRIDRWQSEQSTDLILH